MVCLASVRVSWLDAFHRGGYVVSGFASRGDSELRILLYSHHPLDTQSRSDATFEVSVNAADLDWERVRVEAFRFDRDHNSYFRLACELRDRGLAGAMDDKVDEAVAALQGDDQEARLAALKKLAGMGPAARSAVPSVTQCRDAATDETIRTAANEALKQIAFGTPVYGADEIREVEALSRLQPPDVCTVVRDSAGMLRIPAELTSNGAVVLVVTPE